MKDCSYSTDCSKGKSKAYNRSEASKPHGPGRTKGVRVNPGRGARGR